MKKLAPKPIKMIRALSKPELVHAIGGGGVGVETLRTAGATGVETLRTAGGTGVETLRTASGTGVETLT